MKMLLKINSVFMFHSMQSTCRIFTTLFIYIKFTYSIKKMKKYRSTDTVIITMHVTHSKKILEFTKKILEFSKTNT